MLFNKNLYRLLVCVEYNGNNYNGFQKQYSKNVKTIQQIIENILTKISGNEVKIFCSSRTDKGVHSIGQIFHFDTNIYKREKDWLNISNYNLPNDICFKWVKYVSLNFHARHNVIARRYIYVILNSFLNSSLLYNLVLIFKKKLNIDLMINASKFLLGINDFSSFRSSGCQSNNTIKYIFYFNIFKKGMYIFFDIKANSFLYHMVRNIISCLLLVGIKKYSINWFNKFLISRNRNYCKFNLVKPNGLYLYKIYY